MCVYNPGFERPRLWGGVGTALPTVEHTGNPRQTHLGSVAARHLYRLLLLVGSLLNLAGAGGAGGGGGGACGSLF